MAYTLNDQYTSDINWYFIDTYNRLCVGASAGGILPNIIANNDDRNNQFHSIVNDLPERYKIERNENILSVVQGINPEQDGGNVYFTDFESLARKGLYVFDRVNLINSEDPYYILVVYPIYDTQVDSYPIEKVNLRLIPRTLQSINKRDKNPINLISYFEKIK